LTLSVPPKDAKVADDLAYASMFWIMHMCSVDDDALPLVEQLKVFLTTHLLHWFEVMSILGKAMETIPLLGSLHHWTAVSPFFQL
jgi:hypothetical protein